MTRLAQLMVRRCVYHDNDDDDDERESIRIEMISQPASVTTIYHCEAASPKQNWFRQRSNDRYHHAAPNHLAVDSLRLFHSSWRVSGRMNGCSPAASCIIR